MCIGGRARACKRFSEPTKTLSIRNHVRGIGGISTPLNSKVDLLGTVMPATILMHPVKVKKLRQHLKYLQLFIVRQRDSSYSKYFAL
jgi:hypothetical protein